MKVKKEDILEKYRKNVKVKYDMPRLVALCRKGMSVRRIFYDGDDVPARRARCQLSVGIGLYFPRSAAQAPVVFILAHLQDETAEHLRIMHKLQLYVSTCTGNSQRDLISCLVLIFYLVQLLSCRYRLTVDTDYDIAYLNSSLFSC